jgi:hypothetical protein
MSNSPYTITIFLNVCQRLIDSSKPSSRTNGRTLPQSCISELLPLLNAHEDVPIKLIPSNPYIYPNQKRDGVCFLKLKAQCKECLAAAGGKKTPNGNYSIEAKANPFNSLIRLPEDSDKIWARKQASAARKSAGEESDGEETELSPNAAYTEAIVTFSPHVHVRASSVRASQPKSKRPKTSKASSGESDDSSSDSEAKTSRNLEEESKTTPTPTPSLQNREARQIEPDNDDDEPDRPCECECCARNSTEAKQLRGDDRLKAVLDIILK